MKMVKINENTEHLNEIKLKSNQNNSENGQEAEEENSNNENPENLFKFELDRIEAADVNDLNEIKFTQIFITDDFIKNEIKFDFKENTNLNPREDSNLKIIPNKLKKVSNLLLFTYCQVCKHYDGNVSTNKIINFNFLINNIKHPDSKLVLSSSDLNFKLPNLNFNSLAGYKYFSNFYVIENKHILLIFLVIYNYICVVKLNVDTFDREKKFDVVFQKEFSNTNLLLFLGNEKVSEKNHKLYILMKPGNKLLAFNCKLKSSDKIIITYDEKNVENYLSYNNASTELNAKGKKGSSLHLSKVIVSNSSEIVFYDKGTNKIYLMNKEKLNKIKYLDNTEDNQFRELNNLKNFFVLGEAPNPTNPIMSSTQKNLYLVTDEVVDENLICIKLWRIKNNVGSTPVKTSLEKENTFDPVECEKIQTVFIKSNLADNPFGFYNFTLIDDFHFAVCFYELDEIFVFDLKNQGRTPQSNLYIEKIYELSFQELYACMFDYEINSKGILELILYQEYEFLKYNIDLRNGEKFADTINVTQLEEFKKKQIFNQEPVSEIKNNSNDSIDISIKKDFKITKEKSPKSPIRDNSYVPASEKKIIVQASTVSDVDSKAILADLQKVLGEKIFAGVETKLDNLLNTKLESFSEGLKGKLDNVFSFMKRQTHELDELKKCNNESMLQLTNLILRNKPKSYTQNQVQKHNENFKHNENQKHYENHKQNQNQIERNEKEKEKYYERQYEREKINEKEKINDKGKERVVEKEKERVYEKRERDRERVNDKDKKLNDKNDRERFEEKIEKVVKEVVKDVKEVKDTKESIREKELKELKDKELKELKDKELKELKDKELKELKDKELKELKDKELKEKEQSKLNIPDYLPIEKYIEKPEKPTNKLAENIFDKPLFEKPFEKPPKEKERTTERKKEREREKKDKDKDKAKEKGKDKNKDKDKDKDLVLNKDKIFDNKRDDHSTTQIITTTQTITTHTHHHNSTPQNIINTQDLIDSSTPIRNSTSSSITANLLNKLNFNNPCFYPSNFKNSSSTTPQNDLKKSNSTSPNTVFKSGNINFKGFNFANNENATTPDNNNLATEDVLKTDLPITNVINDDKKFSFADKNNNCLPVFTQIPNEDEDNLSIEFNKENPEGFTNFDKRLDYSSEHSSGNIENDMQMASLGFGKFNFKNENLFCDKEDKGLFSLEEHFGRNMGNDMTDATPIVNNSEFFASSSDFKKVSKSHINAPKNKKIITKKNDNNFSFNNSDKNGEMIIKNQLSASKKKK